MMVFVGASYADATRIYCKMTHNWWKADGAAVGVSVFTSSNPGPQTRMAAVAGENDLWYADLDLTDKTKICFYRVNGSSDISDWNARTEDLAIPTDGTNLYWITTNTGTWGPSKVEGEWLTYSTTPTTLYFVNTGNWTDLHIHAFLNGNNILSEWPGEAMTQVKVNDEPVKINGYDVYSYGLKYSLPAVIFNNGDNGKQTAALAPVAGKPYCYAEDWYTEAEDKPLYFITGNAALVGEKTPWDKKAFKVFTTSYTFNNLAANAYSLKVVTPALEMLGYSSMTDACQSDKGLSSDNDGNINFSLAGVEDVVVSYSGGEISVTGNFVMPTVVLHSDFTGSWADSESFEVSNDRSTASLTVEGLAGSRDYYFGVKVSGTWNKLMANITSDHKSDYLTQAEGNTTLTTGNAGNYTFTYTYSTNLMTVTYPDGGGTAIDEAVDSKKAVKRIVNGQLVIEREGKMYNALGAEVK